MKRLHIPPFLILTLFITACSATEVLFPSTPQPASASNITATPTDDPAILATLFPNMGGNSDMTRTDQQGAIIVEVTPLDLGTPAENLEFDIVLNTHSVDLSMDLATLSTLTTDTGANIQAMYWDAPRGGHHVSGTLIFPSMQEGGSILEGATKLALTIVDLDVPSRVFEWDLR